MILGIGNDIVDMRRLQASWDRRGQRFLDRIYTPDEQAFANARAHPLHVFAKLYAVKEAAVKALGTGFTCGVGWRSVELVRRKVGAVASMKQAAVVAALPKTRSGKTLRNAIRSIADNEAYKLPGTIEDASVIGGIEQAVESIGLGVARGR